MRLFFHKLHAKYYAYHDKVAWPIRTLISLAIIFIIAAVIIFGRGMIGQLKDSFSLSRGLSTDDIDTAASIEEFKTMDSDIEGMTVYDKYKMGLNTEDESDTDMDGLTDKEEIEKYNSDPKKYSTAGDLYSDKYKIDHGLDVNKKIEGGEDQPYPNNNCPEVKLTAERAMDFNANVHKTIGYHELNNADVYAEYTVDMFTGEFAIDISSLIAEGKTDFNTYVAYFGDDEIKKVDTDLESNILTIDEDWDSEHFSIILAKENEGFSLKNSVELNAYVGGYDTSKRLYLVEGSPLASFFGVKDVKIYATNLATEEETNASNAEVSSIILSASDKGFAGDVTFEIVPATRLQIYSKYEGYETFFEFFRQDREDPWLRAFHTYYMTTNPYDLCLGWNLIEKGTTITGDEDAAAVASDDFTIGYDTFPFKNIVTDKSEGNCAGLSYLIAEIYNSNGANAISKGNEIGYSWDITSDPELQKLLSRGIHEYRDDSYYTDTYGSKINVRDVTDSTDSNFLNMMTAYQLLYGGGGFCKGGSYPKWTKMEKILAFLDKGYVIELGVYAEGYISHAIIAYDYEQVDKNRYVLKIYDCNFPDPDAKDLKGASFNLVVQKINVDGTDRFIFDYSPFKNATTRKDYRAFSLTDESKWYHFSAHFSRNGRRDVL